MKVVRMLINNDDFFYEDDMVIVEEGVSKAISGSGVVMYFDKNTYTGRIHYIDTVHNEITLDMSDIYNMNTKTISIENILNIKRK